jgi:hypothetical protein
MANFPFVPGNDSANNLQKSIEGAEQGTTPITPASGRRKLYARSDGWYEVDSAGTARKFSGDVTGAASVLGDEIALFNLTTGKIIKAATGTGFVKVVNGVFQAPSANISTAQVAGRTDGSTVVAPFIGQTIIATSGSPVVSTASTNTMNVVGVLTVPQGKWMLSGLCQFRPNSTSYTDNSQFAIHDTAATFTGTVEGVTRTSVAQTSSTQFTSASIPCVIVTVLTASKDYFLIASSTYSGVNHPSFIGTLQGVRIA